jgi:hypothetical protein
MTTPEQALPRRRLQTSRDRTDADTSAADSVKQDNDWIENFMASLNGIIRKMH